MRNAKERVPLPPTMAVALALALPFIGLPERHRGEGAWQDHAESSSSLCNSDWALAWRVLHHSRGESAGCQWYHGDPEALLPEEHETDDDSSEMLDLSE